MLTATALPALADPLAPAEVALLSWLERLLAALDAAEERLFAALEAAEERLLAALVAADEACDVADPAVAEFEDATDDADEAADEAAEVAAELAEADALVPPQIAFSSARAVDRSADGQLDCRQEAAACWNAALEQTQLTSVSVHLLAVAAWVRQF